MSYVKIRARFLNCNSTWLSWIQYTLAMVGYGDDEYTTTVLELTYNYGVTEYTKGTGYGQVSKSVLVSCIIFSCIAA